MTLPEAIASVRDDIIAAWLKNVEQQPGTREGLWHLVKALELIQRKIEAKLEDNA